MRLSTLARCTAVSLAAATVLAATACSSAGSPDPGANAGQATSTPAGSAPADQSGTDPCALILAADVTAGLGQAVSGTERYETIVDDAGTTMRCALVTDGKPLAGAAFDALSALASGFTGEDLANQPGANVGVVLVNRTTPFDAAAGDMAKLPAGSKTITGLGSFAVVLGVPGSGGLAFAQTSPTQLLVVYDIEDRKVPVDQVEKLLRASVSHLKA